MNQKQKQLRVAIIHEDFSICGGGEKLIGLLANGLLKNNIKADIFTYNISEQTKKIIPKEIKITTIYDKKLPSNDEVIKRYLFSELKLKQKYDVFIFSGHAPLCAAKNNKPNILYCHNIPKSEKILPKSAFKNEDQRTKEIKPPRFERLNKHDIQIALRYEKHSLIEKIWNFFFVLKNKITTKPIPEKISNKIDAIRFLFANSFNLKILKYTLHQITEKENMKQIQNILVNSANIKNKVKNHYKKEATIVYPPIETKKYKNKKNKNYYISINRVTPLKRIELQLKAFQKLPNENLYIIGDIENKKYYNLLNNIKPKNVKFLGVLTEKELIKKLSECKGMIFTAEDEDFGMVPVEAMASGKPVIAPNEGGCKETIITNKTGILINNINENKIISAVNKINQELKNNPKKYIKPCIKQAKKFDVDIFVKNMINEINKLT